jgi:hypothetical protein
VNELTTTTTPAETDLVEMGRIFAASGMFPEHRDAAQCATKLIVGRGLGLSPYDSMNGLHLIQGKPVVASNTMAAAIKRSGRYDYRAVTTDDECSITFFDLGQRGEDGTPATIGTTTFTMTDAKRAGLNGANWKKYPRAMLFARAISAGYREHCPDALGMSPVYVEAHGETEIPRPLKVDEPEAVTVEAVDSRLPELKSLLKTNPEGAEIERRAIEKAGVGSIEELNHHQIERMIEWLTT